MGASNNMKKFSLVLSLGALAAMALTACNPTTPEEPDQPDNPDQPTEKVSVNMSVFYDNSKNFDTLMRYSEGGKVELPYKGADGYTYNVGDFKPVWRQLQKDLDFTINDVTTTNAATIKTTFADYVSTGFKSNDVQINIAQGNADDIVKEGVTNETIVDLSDYLDQMPNFNKFLTENPVVKKVISGAEGQIYYAPYFDGYDDIERMLMVRIDWVEKLLDGDLPTGLDTEKTSDKNYTAWYDETCDETIKVVNKEKTGTTEVTKKYSKNIITTLNELETLNGLESVKALRNYIDETYNEFYGDKRSELFTSASAAYDIDELVALFKCVYTNPGFLTGNKENNITPFFPRASTLDRTAGLWQMLQFFGIRGVESRNAWFYVGEDGKLHDPRGEEKFRDGLQKLRELYQDKMILQNFTTSGSVTSGSDDFRAGLLQNNLGFATYDYNQTTTIYNDDSKCSAIDGFLFGSVLPAVAKWENDDFSHYTESWRTVKQQGWFITEATKADESTFKKCLEIFDYQYSTEGAQLMSYGPAGYVKTDDSGKVVTMDYQGKQVPVLSDETKAQLKELANGNYTNYYRFWVGGTYPIGYVKEQGMEYQTVSAKALPYLDNVNKAIEYGVLNHVNHKDNNTSALNKIVPASFAFTDAEQNAISSQFTDLNKMVSNQKKKYNVYCDIVINGWGTYEGFDLSYENYLTTFNKEFNLEGWTKLYQDAYSRMGL